MSSTVRTVPPPAVAQTATAMVDERALMRKLYQRAFLMRFGIGLTIWFFLRNGSVAFLEDALTYEASAVSVVRDWLAGNQSLWLHDAIQGGHEAWFIVVFIAAIYYLLGGIRAVPVVLAVYCAATALSPVLIYRITRKLGGTPKAAWISGSLVVFSPAFSFWGGALYKEGLIFVFLSLIVYHTILLQERLRVGSLAVLALAIPIMYGLRFYLAVLSAGVVGGMLLLGRPGSKRVGAGAVAVFRQMAIAGAFIVLFMVSGVWARFKTMLPDSPQAVIERVEISRIDLANSSSGYFRDVSIRTPMDALKHLPAGMSYFLVAPLPWQFGSARQNMVIPETTMWLLLYPLIFLGIRAAWRHNRPATITVLVMITIMTAFYAMFIGNIGAAYRMRSQVWLLAAVFAGIGWDLWQAKRDSRQHAHA